MVSRPVVKERGDVADGDAAEYRCKGLRGPVLEGLGDHQIEVVIERGVPLEPERFAVTVQFLTQLDMLAILLVVMPCARDA